MKEAVAGHEKSASRSKKFIAYMFGDAAWTLLIGLGLYRLEGLTAANGAPALAGFVSLLLSMVLVKGFVSVMYIGSQAALDKYVRVAALAVGKDPPPPEEPPK